MRALQERSDSAVREFRALDPGSTFHSRKSARYIRPGNKWPRVPSDKGSKDLADTSALLRVLGIRAVEEAIGVLAAYFPNSAAHADKQRFVLKRLLSAESLDDAPRYPGTSV